VQVPLVNSEFVMEQIFAAIPSPLSEQIPLAQGYGRTLSQGLFADRDHPAYRRATMDGICFSSRVPLGMINGFLAAGQAPPTAWRAGDVWEIMTGASVPEACDCLVPYEDFELDAAKRILLRETPVPGRFIHAQGSDMASGLESLSVGTLLGPMELALAASFGQEMLTVFRMPRIALISTGDEVVPVHASPAPWQIRLSHAEMLRPALLREGASFLHRHAADELAALRALLEEIVPQVDVILFTGGISKGKKDCIREVIESTRGAPVFHGVAQKPGKPMAFWSGTPLLFALPGNPLSVFATYCRYVAPALRAWQGASAKSLLIRLAARPVAHPSLTLLLPVKIDDDGCYAAMNFSNSGNLLASRGAVGIVEVPCAQMGLAAASYRFYPYLIS
jgi:molybdopterin molybdotransferase